MSRLPYLILVSDQVLTLKETFFNDVYLNITPFSAFSMPLSCFVFLQNNYAYPDYITIYLFIYFLPHLSVKFRRAGIFLCFIILCLFPGMVPGTQKTLIKYSLNEEGGGRKMNDWYHDKEPELWALEFKSLPHYFTSPTTWEINLQVPLLFSEGNVCIYQLSLIRIKWHNAY